ncbi:MAG: Cys-tRNA(Pro) deacylase [Actinomycetaceae bacterium]|nr:Cys-tRNA(Pro) deacylase [Actinomycetaceae bacterium]
MEQSASTPAVAFLLERGVEFEELHYNHAAEFDRGFGVEAAEKLGFAFAEVFKTLMVEVDGDAKCVLVPVDHRMSLKKVSRAFGGKRANMLAPDKAQRRTGYVVGGISPFGQKTPAPILIDESCLELDYVVVSGGRRGFSVRLEVLDFLEVSGAQTADILSWETSH